MSRCGLIEKNMKLSHIYLAVFVYFPGLPDHIASAKRTIQNTDCPPQSRREGAWALAGAFAGFFGRLNQARGVINSLFVKLGKVQKNV